MKHKLSNSGWLLSVAFILLGLLLLTIYLIRRSPPHLQVYNLNTERITNSELPVKIAIDRDGIYEVDSNDPRIFGAGFRGIDEDHLELMNNGQVQKFWLDQKSGKIQFYGHAIVSRYTRENIYWLGTAEMVAGKSDATIQDDQNSMGQSDTTSSPVDPIGILSANSYPAVFLAEENQLYNPMVVGGDGWLWEILPAPVKKDVPFEIDAIATGPALIRLMAWANTQASLSPDHHAIIYINGQLIIDERWDGEGWHLIESKLSSDALVDGKNQLEIEMPGDTGTAADIVYLDWFELIYPRSFQVKSDRLNFISPGGQIKMVGFSGPVNIYDVTNPDQVIRVGEVVDAEKGFDSQKGHQYWVIGPGGAMSPLQFEQAVLAPDLHSDVNAADYLAIGPPDLLKALQPLLDWRAGHGLKTMTVPIQAVYDQFNDGILDPQALRNFLSEAQNKWEIAPKYLVLVGDATYDPKGYQTPADANRTPTFFIQTAEGGETASDYGFSLPGEVDWGAADPGTSYKPTVAVGRIPARTAQQVTDYVNKVIAYEKTIGQYNPKNLWQKRILAIADGSESSFRVDAENFLNYIPREYTSQLLTPQTGEQGYSQQIKMNIERGDWLVIYFGHGSVNMWGKDGLFSVKDVANLQNESNLPVLLNLTCLTGLFTHPNQESLAEAFLWKPDGGAIAVLAPTSLTLPEDQSYLSYALVDEMIDKATIRIGDILLNALEQVRVKNPNGRDVLRTFMLFGDPALQLAQPGNSN